MAKRYSDLLSLIDTAVIFPKPAGPSVLSVIEHDDDPHRLARVNLERYAAHSPGATLRYWRGEWFTWKRKRGCYRRIEEKELRARIGTSVKQEFDRINVEHQATGDLDDIPKAHKVTKALITNVIEATAAQCVVSSSIEMPSWINRSSRQPGNYIAMENGLFNMDRFLSDDSADVSDVIEPNTPDWFSAVRLPYSFDPTAACPRWKGFLHHNMEGDQQRINILQEWAGYCLTNNLNETKFLILDGDGSNGKSVYLAGVEAMLGFVNCSHVSLEMFGERFQLNSTLGKLANICCDVGEIDRVAEGHIKAFTDGNPMTFDRKGLSAMEAKPSAKLMLACNNLPRFNDKTDGIWRRVLNVPWRLKIAKEQKVKGMKESDWWAATGELPGIFNWALEGLIRLRTNGDFTHSDICSKALVEYQHENNPTRSFLAEACTKNTAGSLPVGELYAEYKAWCDTNGYRQTSERTFGKDVSRMFPWTEKKRLGMRTERFFVYSGISYAEDFQQKTNVDEYRSKQKVF